MKATLAWIYSLPGSSTCTVISFCPCGNYGSSVCVFIFNSLIRAEARICWATRTVCSCWKWHHGAPVMESALCWKIHLSESLPFCLRGQKSLLHIHSQFWITSLSHWYIKENCQPEIKASFMFTSTEGVGSTFVIPGNHSNNNRPCWIKPPLCLFP